MSQALKIYVPEGDDTADYIHPSEWGRDHWNTLAYLETCCVDNEGKVRNESMRCNPRIHRELLGRAQFDLGIGCGEKYPTRLKSGMKENHDDWSCVEDMARFGILTAKENRISNDPFCSVQAVVTLTPKGEKYANAIRVLKSRGLKFSTIEHDHILNFLKEGKKA